jgi:hypothetical protein
MLCWVLMQMGMVISQMTVQRITNIEKKTDKVKASIIRFDSKIRRRFKDKKDLACDGAKPNPEDGS